MFAYPIIHRDLHEMQRPKQRERERERDPMQVEDGQTIAECLLRD